MPSILSGCVSILLFRSLAKKCVHDPISRLFAIALYCSSPHILMYDQMARVYSIVLMLALMLYSSMIDIIQRRDNWITYTIIAGATAVGLYSFNLFPLLSFVVVLFILYYSDTRRRIKTLLAYGIAGLVYLPLFLNFTIQQMKLVRETHLPFLLIVSLIFIFVPFLASERPPTTISTFDMVWRLSAYIYGGMMIIMTVINWLRYYHLKST
jgi:hypothetical protein